MISFETIRILAVTLVLSAVAPLVLAAAGVADADLLLVVFSTSVLVGCLVAGYVRRKTMNTKTWFVDSRRMP